MTTVGGAATAAGGPAGVFGAVGAAFAGGAFLSRWSWLLTLPFAVTVLGGYDAAATASERAGGFAVAFVVHAVLGCLGAPFALAERRLSRASARACVAIAAVVVLGCARPLLVSALTAWAGLPPYPAPFGVRLATNLVAAAVALPIVAVVVTALRRRAQAVAALGQVAEAMRAGRSGGSDLRAAAADETQAAAARFRAELGALVECGRHADAATRAAALRAFARDTARSLSHRLADVRPPLPPGEPGDPRPRPAGTAARRAPARLAPAPLAPAPPGLAVALLVAAYLPYTLAHEGVAAAIASASAALVIGVLGELATVRLAGAPGDSARARTRARTAVVGATATGLALALGPPLLTGGAPELFPVLPSYLAVALVAGSASEAVRRLRHERAQLEREIAAYTADTAEHGRAVRERREALLRALHDDAQGGCLVVAAILERDPAAAEAQRRWREALAELERVGRLLDDATRDDATRDDATRDHATRDDPIRHDGAEAAGSASAGPAGSAAFATVLGAWSRALALDVSAAPTALDRLDREPELGRFVVDLASEALVNAVKHGAPSAAVRLSSDADGAVRVEVSAPGRLRRGRPSSPGIGLDALRLRALGLRAEELLLLEHDGRVVLRARLGGPVATPSAALSQQPNTAPAG